MSDSITVQNQPTNYFSRLMNSIKGIGFGALLFIFSFVVLYNSEGGTDFSKIANKAIPVDALSADVAANDGNFVALEGKLVTESTIGDQIALANGATVTIQPGAYIELQRNVEYFSWVEKSNTSSDSASGSSSTTYTYSKTWTSTIEDSADFHLPVGHENPVALVMDNDILATDAKIGNLAIDLKKLGLPATEKLVLNPTIVEIVAAPATTPVIAANTVGVDATAQADTFVISSNTGGTTTTGFQTTVETGNPPQAIETTTATPDVNPASGSQGLTASLIDGSYVYYGSNYATPALGDVRISYAVIKSGEQVTAFGKIAGDSLVTYVANGDSLYRAFSGTKDEALNTMHGEFVFYLWLMRIIGFLMMWGGLGMILAPISAVLDFLPLIGGLSKSVVSGITFVLAFVLTFLTILVAKVAHNPFIMIVVVLALGIGIYFWITGQTKKQGN